MIGTVSWLICKDCPGTLPGDCLPGCQALQIDALLVTTYAATPDVDVQANCWQDTVSVHFSVISALTLLTALRTRYVTEQDLDFFKDHVERNVQLEGAGKWEQQMDKDFSTFNYAAWRRILPVSRLATWLV